MFSVLVILSRGSKKCCPKVFMLPMESRQLSSYTSVSSQRKWNSRDKWIFQWTCSNNWRKESCSFYFSGLKQLCHNYFIPIKFHLLSQLNQYGYMGPIIGGWNDPPLCSVKWRAHLGREREKNYPCASEKKDEQQINYFRMYLKINVERALKALILGSSSVSLPSQVKHWKSVGKPTDIHSAPLNIEH